MGQEIEDTEVKNLKTGSLEWTEDRLFKRWELVRRHNDYRDFCDRNKDAFDKDGMFDESTSKLYEDSFREEVGKIRKRFGLNLLYYCKTKLRPGEIVDRCVFKEPFAVTILFNNPPVGEKPVFIDGAKVRSQSDILWDGKKIQLEVNIRKDITDGQLKDEFMEYVNEGRIAAGITKTTERPPGDKMFKIYDWHGAGFSVKEIIKKAWPAEYKKEFEREDSDDDLYEKLVQKYKKQGTSDWDEKAYDEAYGNSGIDGPASGKIRLYMRVRDNIKRMKELISVF